MDVIGQYLKSGVGCKTATGKYFTKSKISAREDGLSVIH
jgi:hypothetical protein